MNGTGTVYSTHGTTSNADGPSDFPPGQSALPPQGSVASEHDGTNVETEGSPNESTVLQPDNVSSAHGDDGSDLDVLPDERNAPHHESATIGLPPLDDGRTSHNARSEGFREPLEYRDITTPADGSLIMRGGREILGMEIDGHRVRVIYRPVEVEGGHVVIGPDYPRERIP
jgi:hypothetical protein